MTEFLAPVVIPYARFLEVRTRRLDIVTELGHHEESPAVAVSSEPIADDERSHVAEHVLAADAAGVQRS